jgi:hypothetical protein
MSPTCRSPLHALVLSALLSGGAMAAEPMGTIGDESASIARRTCGTPMPAAEEMLRGQRAIELYRSRFGTPPANAVIPVSFHVITCRGEGDVTRRQIDEQIRVLNRAYEGTGYRFDLASVDRTEDCRWFSMLPGTGDEKHAKEALAIDVPHRLNVYTCQPRQNLLGWAYFPQSIPEDHPLHGVVLHYGSLPGGPVAYYNLGGTLPHEVGHYLGLYHTFQNGCVAPGDFVDDTPFEATPNTGCPTSRNTCPSPGDDPIHNYMDYSIDACYSEITAGQDERMDAIVPVYRPSLLGGSSTITNFDRDPAPAARATGGVLFRGAFPNPFRTETRVLFRLPESAHVTLGLYDVAGHRVRTLADGDFPAGEHGVTLEAGTLPAGTYFAALKVGGVATARTVLLVR